MENPLQHFAELSDPRVEGRSDHLLEEILLITIAAVLSGADSWNEIEDYGKAKQDWLGSFLRLPGVIPSHDTFNRVFSLLDPAEPVSCFLGWISSIAQMTAGEVVAIDGKSLRGTREGGRKMLVHMVSAWANSNNLVLGQQKVEEKSNEITAIPKLPKVLELSGTIVTIDAMDCQKSIAQQILDKEADYILAVEENQLHLLEDRRDSFKMLLPETTVEEVDCGHGRVETRRCPVLGDLSLLEQAADRSGAAQLGHSPTLGIEDKLHWVLDAAFREDASRNRTGNAAQNFSRITRIALNLLKQNKTSKLGMKGKRLKAGWDNDYLLQLLGVTV